MYNQYLSDSVIGNTDDPDATGQDMHRLNGFTLILHYWRWILHGFFWSDDQSENYMH